MLGTVLAAQTANDFAEYQGWMKSNAATVADLNQRLTAKDGAAAHTDVRKLQENLAMVMAYWQSRNIRRWSEILSRRHLRACSSRRPDLAK